MLWCAGACCAPQAQGQTHSGLAVIDKDAAQFVKYTDKELGKLVAKYSKGQLAAPAGKGKGGCHDAFPLLPTIRLHKKYIPYVRIYTRSIEYGQRGQNNAVFYIFGSEYAFCIRYVF